MSYIDRNLLPDERILFRTRKHLIIFFYPLILVLIAIYAYQYMDANPILASVKWAPMLVVLIYTGSVWLEYITSEFAITNKRVMMREGFFFRHMAEIRLNTLSQINVDQSLIGQILGYGIVTLNAFGAYDAFTMIDKPVEFQKVANEQLDKVAR